MTIEVELYPEQEEVLRWHAGHLGVSFEEYVQRVIQEEAKRAGHIRRSQPRSKLPSGRPRLTPEELLVRQLAQDLAGVFDKLRGQLGEEFEAIHGKLYREFEQAVASKDVETLQRFQRESPWVRRWST